MQHLQTETSHGEVLCPPVLLVWSKYPPLLRLPVIAPDAAMGEFLRRIIFMYIEGDLPSRGRPMSKQASYVEAWGYLLVLNL